MDIRPFLFLRPEIATARFECTRLDAARPILCWMDFPGTLFWACTPRNKIEPIFLLYLDTHLFILVPHNDELVVSMDQASLPQYPPAWPPVIEN